MPPKNVGLPWFDHRLPAGYSAEIVFIDEYRESFDVPEDRYDEWMAVMEEQREECETGANGNGSGDDPNGDDDGPDENGNDSDDNSQDQMPGFGLGAAITAIGGALGAKRYLSRRDSEQE
ncbi:hypothetical protein [Natranaeroarchaeum aerophilus]|uniref:PGF-CTERM sorting domain-containing protein n=1 Tax=Natranaeroarchaeum aerophilus TaxID=2917711 RepID=A0AAE3FRZ2_9EURY|nr:hypothetical protein [Natranaeroarchaeum aerophilus]MCL9814086.1 hypothetical protein [Natranaeroarchaeum aerophilus]